METSEGEKDTKEEILEVGKVARQIARTIWNETNFRFIYKRTSKSQTDSAIKTFQFFCSQFDAEQAKSKVHPDVKKQRSRDKMQRYPCGGWLNITMRDGHPEEARIRLTHKSHPEYVSISISPADRKIIENMRHHSPSKIWDYILEQDPDTELTEKQIQTEW
ncbi:hypothetical protein F5878DRAFT_517893, partial [Lentinula raphanica]